MQPLEVPMDLCARTLLAVLSCCPAYWCQCEVQKLQSAGADGLDLLLLAMDGDEAVLRSGDRVLLFSSTPFGWVETGDLTPSDALGFGPGEAALEGNTLAIGSSGFTDPLQDGAVYVYERSAPGEQWVETAKLVPPVGASLDVILTFGESVALEGDVLAVGAPEWILGWHGKGLLSIHERAGGLWTAQGSFLGDSGTSLGTAIAIEGGQVFASAPFQGAFASPALRIYEKVGAEWKAVQHVTGDDGANAMDIAAEGARLAIADNIGLSGVFILEHTGGTWSKAGALSVPPGGWSPSAVAFDGPRILAGDSYYSSGSGLSAGAAFLFEQVGPAWTAGTALVPKDLEGSDRFGDAVALEGDRILAAGADKDLGASHYSTYGFSASGHGCPSLTSGLYVVSSAAGGVQVLELDASAAHAGELYLLAGSLSGFWPGTPFAGQTIPLNSDVYLLYTLFHGGSPPLVGNFGFLDAAGQAVAQVVLPGDPMLAGLQAHHAFGAVDAAFNLVHISNPVPLLVQ